MRGAVASSDVTGRTEFPEPREWALTVVEVTDRSRSLRRISFAGEQLGALEYFPGQDMAIAVPAGEGTTVRRRYTLRSRDLQRGTVVADFVLHGDGPAARWATAAAAGHRVDAIAPRGKITVDAEADWHLFAGDEAAAPGVAAMIEALSPGAKVLAFLEVGDAADEQDISVPDGVDAEIAWLHRGETPVGDGARLVDRLAEVKLPDGTGRAYLAGEYSVVHAMRRACADLGLAQEAISPKPYWRIGRGNQPHGEPERD